MGNATHVHIFDKGCHQPWYCEFILANYLVVRNDGGDRMRIVRCGEHPTCHSCQIMLSGGNGKVITFESLERAVVDRKGSDLAHFLDDALAIRTQEYGS